MGWFRRSTPNPPVEFGCDYCADDDNRYYEHVTRIGFDEFRGLRLLRCPHCESLYEETSNGEDTRRLTVAEAKTRFLAAALEATEQQVPWHRVYSFTDDPEHIEQLQKVSLDRSDFGLAPDPLVGSGEWWAAIDSGRLPTVELDGEIEDAFWGSMRDWPSCHVRDDSGESTTWTREGEYRRYVEGLRIRIRYVPHEWKRPGVMTSTKTSQVVLSIDVEESPRRSAAIAPGPGDFGYELARREGEVGTISCSIATSPTCPESERQSSSSVGSSMRSARGRDKP